MAVPGWLSIRNIPVNTVRGRSYFDLLSKCLSGKRVCPSCNGVGAVKCKDTPLKMKAAANVRFQGIKQLEHLKDNPDTQMGDVIRELLEEALHKRQICPRCNGYRFVKASG